MRNQDRIEPFLQELGTLWKETYPDMRFGQLLVNFFYALGDPFYIEENEMLEAFRAYCKGENPQEVLMERLKRELEKGYEK